MKCLDLLPGSVPLHEAAESDSVDCVKALLALGAPAHPRNAHHHTPASIARRMNHSECYNLLGMYKCETLFRKIVADDTQTYIAIF